MMVEIECHMPAKIFTSGTRKVGKQMTWGSLVSNDMLVPLAFFAGYGFFLVLLYTSPGLVAPPHPHK
jgi:hypothetical protein